MRETVGRKRGAWFWTGVILLTISALLWLVIILLIVSKGDGAGALVGVLFTAIPIGIGIYGIRRGRKTPTVEKLPSKWSHVMTEKEVNSNIYFEAILSLFYLCLLPITVALFPQTTPKDRFNVLRDLFSRRTQTIGRVTNKLTVKREVETPAGTHSHNVFTGNITVGQLEFKVKWRVYRWLRYNDEVVVEYWPHSMTVASIERKPPDLMAE